MKNLKKAGTKERDIKKVLYPVSAVVLVLGLGVGAILLSMLNVQVLNRFLLINQMRLRFAFLNWLMILRMRKSAIIFPGRNHILPNINIHQ